MCNHTLLTATIDTGEHAPP